MRAPYVVGVNVFVATVTDSSAAGGHSVAFAPEPPSAPHAAKTSDVASASTGPRRAEFIIRLLPSMRSGDCILRHFLRTWRATKRCWRSAALVAGYAFVDLAG